MQVHEKTFPVLLLSRQDLEDAGYDASKVSDQTMKRLASLLEDVIIEKIYWDYFPLIADELNIPKNDTK